MLLAELDRALAGLGPEERVLVACSGGVDSVVLLHAAVGRLGCRRVIAAHVDHATRASSSEDAAFVGRLSEEFGIELRTTRLASGPASEARLRELRYAALEAERERVGARLILLGHHAGDQAETVLLGLLRTTRVEALGGMPACRGALSRPFLGVEREAILAYARAQRLTWRDDPTNLDPGYLRNRIRKELLPLLERRYRPGIRRRLAALAAERERQEPSLSANRSTPSPVTEDVPFVFPAIVLERRPWLGGQLPDGKSEAAFDAALLPSPVVRAPRSGDRIQPFGMDGHKKLQDVLVDAKVPRTLRGGLLIVATPGGEVVWVPGLVRSALAPIGPGTREAWIFRRPEDTTCDGAQQRSL
jgi:tRNA(Ile)-lysidine synthetase-like protein